MASAEVYASPTVKQVIFQVRYANLFYLEQVIGDYQKAIMKQFPESELIIHQKLVFQDIGPEIRRETPVETSSPAIKIWRFKSPDGVVLNVLPDSLDLSSTAHKTYNAPGDHRRFRDAIQFAVDRFLELTSLPTLKRIGLRYIDECPLPADNAMFTEWYNTAFPLDRFNVDNASELAFVVHTQKSPGNFLRFAESYRVLEGVPQYTLDFDGHTENVPSERYLPVTDILHEIIDVEWRASLREPVFQLMRRPPGE